MTDKFTEPKTFPHLCASTFMNIDATNRIAQAYPNRELADAAAANDRIAVFRRDYEDGVLIGFHVEKAIL